MSYAHHDDDDGRLTKFRERLVAELRSQIGRDVEIFKDDDIALGEPWRDRLEHGLAASTFLLAIVTPSFLTSAYCAEELATFVSHERELGHDDLILPVYYIDCADFARPEADEAAAGRLRLLLAREYFDWRALRLLRPSDPRVPRAQALLATQIREAMARTATAIHPPASPSPPAPGAAPRSEAISLTALIDALLDADPVTSRPAAQEIARRGAQAIPAVVERLEGLATPTVFVVRGLLGRFADTSGPLMVRRIANADGDWHAASIVPSCLSTAHNAVCRDDLAALLRNAGSQIDATRMATEALGYIGANVYTNRIFALLEDSADSSDLFEKYSSYCVEAVARIVGLTTMKESFVVRGAIAYVESALELVGSRDAEVTQERVLREILAECKPHHGDQFASRWLTSSDERLRELGAHALGGIGLRRAVPALLERCADPHESAECRRSAIKAVGVVGGALALEGLGRLELDVSLEHWRQAALLRCAPDHMDDAQFRALARDHMSGTDTGGNWMLQAIGWRRDATFLTAVRRGLQDDDHMVRADAALALARIRGADERDELLQARTEASTVRERLLTSLAVLLAGEPPADDPDLAEVRTLLYESFMYHAPTRRDIIDALRRSRDPRAHDIADAWQPIYDALSAY